MPREPSGEPNRVNARQLWLWQEHFHGVSARGSAWLCWGHGAEGQLAGAGAGAGAQRRTCTERRSSRYLDHLDVLLHLRPQLLLQLGCEETGRDSDA